MEAQEATRGLGSRQNTCRGEWADGVSRSGPGELELSETDERRVEGTCR
jgi:hypothetical protein